MLAGLMAALLVSPVVAQQSSALPLRVEAEQLVFDAMGQQLVLPPPDWRELDGTAPEALLDLVSAYFNEDQSQARIEIYPRGEGEALWTRLYGARIFNQPSLALPNLRSAIIDVYSRACRPETVALFQLEPDDGDMIPPMGFVCGAYLDMPGYAGQGEVMITGFYRSEMGVAMVFQEWRGPAFDPADSATWPVTTAEIETRVVQFKSGAALEPAD